MTDRPATFGSPHPAAGSGISVGSPAPELAAAGRPPAGARSPLVPLPAPEYVPLAEAGRPSRFRISGRASRPRPAAGGGRRMTVMRVALVAVLALAASGALGYGLLAGRPSSDGTANGSSPSGGSAASTAPSGSAGAPSGSAGLGADPTGQPDNEVGAGASPDGALPAGGDGAAVAPGNGVPAGGSSGVGSSGGGSSGGSSGSGTDSGGAAASRLVATYTSTAKSVPNGFTNVRGTVAVRNPGSAAAARWQVTITLPAGARVTAVQGASVVLAGTRAVFTPFAGAGALAPRSSAVFTFRLPGLLDVLPAACTIDGRPCD